MDVVVVGEGYRITIRRRVREVVPLKIGQKVEVVPLGNRILVQPLPEEPEEKLVQLTKDVVFNRKARRKASKFLITQLKN